MTKTIDLPRVRRALVELDRIAAEHPNIRPIDGLEQLEQLVMTTTNQERLAKYREKQQQKGLKRVTVYLSPNAQAALRRLQDRTGESQSEILSDAVIHAALTKEEK